MSVSRIKDSPNKGFNQAIIKKLTQRMLGQFNESWNHSVYEADKLKRAAVQIIISAVFRAMNILIGSNEAYFNEVAK